MLNGYLDKMNQYVSLLVNLADAAKTQGNLERLQWDWQRVGMHELSE